MDLSNVWLEDAAGQRWHVAATCSIGRSATNSVVLDDGKVSRRHALVHKQDETEYWIIDLGSGNGTYLNGRRVTLPTRLADGDQLALGDHTLAFRQISVRNLPEISARVSEQTIIAVKNVDCWLLVADIKDSTALAQRLSPTDMAMQVGRWMSGCKEIVDGSGGSLNKFLGDGFLAFWSDDGDGGVRVLGALAQLRGLQQGVQSPRFRLVLHYGSVAFGGGGSLGEDSLSGLDVTTAFRMERIASSLGCEVFASEVVRERLAGKVKFRDLGRHLVPGFGPEGQRFYAIE
jgi:adenylate cyclase